MVGQKTLTFLFMLLCFPLFSFAQDGGSGGGVFELGGFIGNLLPNQVPAIEEIHPQWGLRTGFGTGEGGGVVEFSVTGGNGNGAEWNQASVSLRMDVPVPSLVGSVYIGGDAVYFQGVSQSKKFYGGGHVGGSIMSLISKDLWFRADMKFNVNPGTSLLIAAGFTFRFGASEGAAK